MTVSINDKERAVLVVLAEAYQPDEWGAYNFKGLAGITKLEVKDIRRACRSLAKKGLAQYERVLWNEDTGPCGAGYRATEAGAAFIGPCDICGERATYDYQVNNQGHLALYAHGTDQLRRVRECEEHYKVSAKEPQQTKIV